MRIGILGGTFDPIHNGHLELARAAVLSLELDEVLFIPAHRNPNKKSRSQASARDRLKMVQIAVKDEPKFSVSDIEIQRAGPSYAIETLQDLSHVRPANYWFILGADSAKGIHTWKQPERLVRYCRLAVALRPPETWEDLISKLKPEFRAYLDKVEMKPMDISSTEIRERVSQKQPVNAWLPASVLQYIREHKLYEN